MNKIFVDGIEVDAEDFIALGKNKEFNLVQDDPTHYRRMLAKQSIDNKVVPTPIIQKEVPVIPLQGMVETMLTTEDVISVGIKKEGI
jgi:hypothetical protein